MTEPVTHVPRRAADPQTATDWLDAVASGACDRQEFTRGVGELLRRAPDTGWEILALLDQYFRRGKLTSETFGSLKTHLQELLMGKNGGQGISAPLVRAAPAPAPARAAASAQATATFAARQPERRRPEVVRSIFAPAPATAETPDPGPDMADDEAATIAPRVERAPKLGDVLRGRYRIDEVLGQGGMGTVFGAVDQYRVDRDSDRRVAIKVLHSAVLQRPRLFTELRREFQHLQSLSHPNIVRVHEFDRDGELAFFTMERLSGALLSRVLTANRASPAFRPYALAIIRDVGAAVTHAHSRSVIHGDLNPVNIFVTDEGSVRVLDFGAAGQLRRAPWISEFENQEQTAVATPSYASCQVLEGETPDARDDVYGLACVAYVLLTGKHPFREHTALKARSGQMKPVRPSGLSGRQWKALREGLSFERERRPADIRAWMDRLDVQAPTRLPALPELFRGRVPPRRQGALRVAIALVLIVGVATGVWWETTHPADLLLARAAASRLWNERFPTDPAPARTTDVGAAPRESAGASADAALPESLASAPPAVDAVAPSTRTSSSAATGATSSETASPTPIPSPVRSPAPVAAVSAVPAPNGVHARIELAADTVEVAPGQSVAQVTIHRSRMLRGDVSFSWWTESGTAKPGRDFVPFKSEVEHIPEGKSSLTLMIPVVTDPNRREDRSFYVVIDQPSDNAAVGPRTLTMVTLSGLE